MTSTRGHDRAQTVRVQNVGDEPVAAPTCEGSAAPGQRILLIDDEPLVRGTIAPLPERLGHTVIVASTGTGGLARGRLRTQEIGVGLQLQGNQKVCKRNCRPAPSCSENTGTP